MYRNLGREHTRDSDELWEDRFDVVVVGQLGPSVDLQQHLVAVGRVELEADLKLLGYFSLLNVK